MATRSRGRRGQPGPPIPAPRAGTRSTRNATQESEEMVVDDSQDQMLHEESLQRDPPPRRSAPAAPSDVTIPTRPEGGSDQDDEVTEEAQADGEGRQQNGETQPETQEPEPPVEQETDEMRLAVMAAGLPDVHRLSEDLWMRLNDARYDSQQFRLILNMKRRAFKAIREEYEDERIAPFVDTRRLRHLDEEVGGQGNASTVLRKMNLTSALDIIDSLLVHGRGKENISKEAFLQALAEGGLGLLVKDGTKDDTAPGGANVYPELLLDIYTHIFIERLAADESDQNPLAIVSDVFCFGQRPTSKRTYERVFSHGPFVSLGGSKDAGAILVADRIQSYVPLRKKKERGVPALREMFDFEKFLERLRGFVLKAWPADADVFYDAPDTQNLDGTPVAFHRPVQQPDSAPPRQLSHPVQQLAQISPSTRRQTTGPLPHHDVRYPSPPSHVLAPAEASRTAAQSLHKLGEHDLGTGDDDDFQTDTRSLTIIPARRPPPNSGQSRPSKRQRIHDASLPPSSMPPPSTAPPQYSTQPGSAPDFEAIKAKKRAISAQARAERGEAPTQQRKPWSSADCTTLLHCIYERHASWSQIQAEDSHKFEVPRNQQAYRDKARNMKVDYLITDANLPPCFDLVALGSKEKARLISMGKNPNRREADLDDNNNPINVAYIPPDQQQQLVDSMSQTQSQPELSQQQAPEPQMA